MPNQMQNLDARVPVTIETRDRLRALKTGSDRYEDVITRLLEKHEQIPEPPAETA